MTRNILDILRQVPPAGPIGFEGLIADSLQCLTGTHFNLANAGYQEGRDMSSRPQAGNVTAVECKRYGAAALSLRELQGELVQVELAVRDLDLWVLVSSRSLDSRRSESLHALAVENGHGFLAISAADGDPSSLEALISFAPEVTANHPAILQVSSSDEVRPLLQGIAGRPGFVARISALKEAFTSPLVGYENWRIEQNQNFLRTLISEQQAQASYGQPIHVEDPQVKLIRRDGLWAALDQWSADWNRDRVLAVLGEEGDGKTWGATSWLADKVKHNPDFPGVIFLSSGGVYETEFTGRDLHPLFSRIIKERILGITNDQAERRLSRWTSRKNQLPLFLLVLDGTNERRSPSLWRGLLEQLGGEPWSTYVRILITCRTAFWKRHFAGLRLISAKTFTLGPFDDVELNAALAHHELRREDLPTSVLPLIRKPRYFDLMVKHYRRLAESGDLTVARLIYEDWRDRYERKRSISLSDEDFQNFIRGLIEAQTGKSSGLSGDEIKFALPPDLLNQEEVIREIQTGGILRPDKNKFRIDEKLLVYGLSLLLVDQLEKASLAAEDPHEAIASWLEPHADMDIKAAICEHAVLHALTSNILPLEFKVALLVAWVSNHNQTETTESNLAAYLPICPQAYVSLSEVVWSSSFDTRWVQEVLTRAFIRWYESPQVASVLLDAFERWLGFVHTSGSAFRRDEDRIREAQQEMASRVGREVKSGSFNFAGYTFTGIDDDGQGRLSRVALAVISHLPRKSFIRALVIGCLTEVIAGTRNRHELLSWVFRTSEHDLGPSLNAEIDRLLQTDNAVTRRAARRLLWFEGSKEASRLQQEISSETTGRNFLSELHRQDPCTSGLAWTADEAVDCLKREDLDPRWVAERIAKDCINPNLNISDALKKQLRGLVQEIDINEMWVVKATTGADHTFKTYEPVLAAFAPDVLADLVRSVIMQVGTREGVKRRQVSFHLEEHRLILREGELDAIRAAWQQLLDNPSEWGEAERVAEMCLFKEVLLEDDGDQQLVNLLSRPDGAADLIDYEQRFLPIADWHSVEVMLSEPKDANALRRTLWFLSANPEAIPPDLMTQFIVPLINHEDSHVRSKTCQLIYQKADEAGISGLIHGNWHWNPSEDGFQNHWASLILSQFGTQLPFKEVCRRVYPSFWGYTVTRRGNKAEEVQTYAETLDEHLSRIVSGTPDLPLDLPPFEIESRTDAKIQDIRHRTLPPGLFKRTISFIDISSTRGGDESSDDFSPEDFNEAAIEEQPEKFRAIVHDAIDQQHNAGNVLFGQEFHTYGLHQIVKQRPDLVAGWLSRIDPNTREGRAFISRASSFCDALCTVLLKEQVETGMELYWKLQESETRIRVIDHDTQMDLLDFALFDVAASESIIRAWQLKLEQSYSDIELLRVAMLAQHGNGGEWLWSYTAERLDSNVPIHKARARVLLGFIEKPEASAVIKKLFESDPETWVRQLVQKSKERQDKNAWAKHWFRRMLIGEDDVSAWAAFRLFLRCVDTRFWFWQEQIENDIEVTKVTKRRRDFFDNNIDNIRNAIRNNESEIAEQFLGQKIMKRQVWPWM